MAEHGYRHLEQRFNLPKPNDQSNIPIQVEVVGVGGGDGGSEDSNIFVKLLYKPTYIFYKDNKISFFVNTTVVVQFIFRILVRYETLPLPLGPGTCYCNGERRNLNCGQVNIKRKDISITHVLNFYLPKS